MVVIIPLRSLTLASGPAGASAISLLSAKYSLRAVLNPRLPARAQAKASTPALRPALAVYRWNKVAASVFKMFSIYLYSFVFLCD